MFANAARLFARAARAPVARGAVAGGGLFAAASFIGGTAISEDTTYTMIKDMHTRIKRIENQLGASKYQKDLDRIAEIKISNPTNIAIKNFDVEYFYSLSDSDKAAFIQVIRTGIDNPDSGMGCYAMQPEDYNRFKPFFKKVLAEYHGVSEDAVHVNNWSLEGVEGLPKDGNLDLGKLGLPPLSMRVRTGRNLADFPLPGAMNQDDRVKLEKKMCTAFEQLIKDPSYGGRYYSLTPGHPDHIDDKKYNELVKAHIMFKDMAADPYLASAGIASDWPYGRGCYVSKDKGFIIWVGEEDHLRIMCMAKGASLNGVFDRLKGAIDVVNNIPGLAFAHDDQYGIVTSCPTNLGTAMRASVHIGLPKLCADGTDKKAKAVCKPLGLSVRGTGGEHTPIGEGGVCDISPSARFCISEAEIVTALYHGIKNLKEKEDTC
jgi:creatine kinase